MLAWNVWLFLLSSHFPEFSFILTATQISTAVVCYPFIGVVVLAVSGFLHVCLTSEHRFKPKNIMFNLCIYLLLGRLLKPLETTVEINDGETCEACNGRFIVGQQTISL